MYPCLIFINYLIIVLRKSFVTEDKYNDVFYVQLAVVVVFNFLRICKVFFINSILRGRTTLK